MCKSQIITVNIIIIVILIITIKVAIKYLECIIQ